MNPRTILGNLKNFGRRVKHTRIYDERLLYEAHEISILKKVVNSYSIDCIFDIGANQGQYARMLRKRVKYRGLIISVEPNPETFCLLQKAARFDKKWQSKSLALASHNGEQRLSIMSSDQFTSLSNPITTETSQLAHLNSVAKQVMVPVKTLETFFLETRNDIQFERPFLKMDTQGYDAIIARSAGRLIREFVGIQTEISFIRLYADSLSYEDTLKMYNELGFTLCAILPNNAGHFPYLIEQDAIFLNNEFFGI